MNGVALFSGHNYDTYMYQKWQNVYRSVSGCGSGDMAVSLLLINYHFSQITYLNFIYLLHIRLKANMLYSLQFFRVTQNRAP
jgi:hypothetical protein